MTHGNSDRLEKIGCWCDRLKLTTHSNSDRLQQTHRKYIVKAIA
ncbi:MAG: hypothetical protein ACOYN8_00960 [Pseudanabaena sp.]